MNVVEPAELRSSYAKRVRRSFDRFSNSFGPIVDRFPLVDRELSRAAVNRRLFAFRVVAAAIFSVIVLTRWLDGMTGAIGGHEFTTLTCAIVAASNLIIALAVAPLMAASLIAEEKQERTLPLLLMADFRGTDIFLAKFLSVFLVCALLVFSTAPLLAMGSIFGGVELGGIAALLVLSFALVAESCSIGLWASVRSRGPREAILLTFVVLTCWHAGLIYLEQWRRIGVGIEATSSPIIDFVEFANTGAAPSSWLIATVQHGVIAGLLGFWTIRKLPGLAYDEHARRPRKRRRVAGGALRWFRGHPLVQLIAATTSGFTLSFDSWPLRLVSTIGLALIAAVTYGYAIILIVLIFCYDVASCMTSIRRSGALDDILATPLEQNRVARAFVRVFAARALVYVPAMVIAAFIVAINNSMQGAISWPVLMAFMVLLPSQVFLIVAAGSYAGTRTNRAASQAALTILLLGLTLTLAFGLSQTAYWYLPSGSWRVAIDQRATIILTLLGSAVLNVGSGALCYVAFASQLREDLISNMRPKFQSLLDSFTN